MMDVIKLRDSGDLSDFTVYVDSARFKLHKFPLYTKSEFFKEIASSSPVCELKDFPGGAKIFSKIADYCYGKEIEIIPQNVLYLNVGAEILKMKGKDNLSELTRKYIHRIFADASDKRDTWKLICIACLSCLLKNEEAKKVYDDCIEFLESIWLPSYELGPRTPKLTIEHLSKPPELENDWMTDHLIYLPLEAVLNLMKTANDRSCNNNPAIRLAANYLARVLDYHVKSDENNTKLNENKNTENSSPDSKGILNFLAEYRFLVQPITKDKIDGTNTSCQCKGRISEETRAQLEKLYSEDELLASVMNNPANHFEKVLDAIDDVSPIADCINTNWITTALQLTDKNTVTPKCRNKILIIAYNMLPRMCSEDLKNIPPKVLGDIITVFEPKEKQYASASAVQSRRSSRRVSTTDNLTKNDTEDPDATRKQSIARQPSISEANFVKTQGEPVKQLSETVTEPIIQYMSQKAEVNELTVPEYVRLVSKVKMPKCDYDSTDNLVKIFHKIVKSNEKPTEEDIEKILKQINLSNCSPETLNEALEANLFPPKLVAEAAINVAKKQDMIPELPNCSQYKPLTREKSVSPVRTNLYHSSTYSPCPISSSSYLPMRQRTRCPDLLHQMPRCSRFRSSSSIPQTPSSWRNHIGMKPWVCPRSTYKPIESRAETYRRFPEFATTDELLDKYENMCFDSPNHCSYHFLLSRPYSPLSRF